MGTCTQRHMDMHVCMFMCVHTTSRHDIPHTYIHTYHLHTHTHTHTTYTKIITYPIHIPKTLHLTADGLRECESPRYISFLKHL